MALSDSALPPDQRDASFCVLPYRRWLVGPITALRLTRTIFIYLAIFLTGLGLAQSLDLRMQALGLALMAPGAGFLLHASSVDLHGGLHLASPLSRWRCLYLRCCFGLRQAMYWRRHWCGS